MEESVPFRFYAEPDRAVLWWEKPAAARAGQTYEVLLDGRPVQTVDRTHCTLTGLLPQTAYRAAAAMDGQTLGTVEFTTPKPRARLDVTAAPFFAAGDGQTLNTAALQAAIDACGAGQEVYFPAGVYRTGALRLHSDMALYLADGAELRGSADPMDYLPRIPSRFEGVERECFQSLLNLGTLDHSSGPNCRSVVITGGGTIRGGGYPLARATIEAERERLKAYPPQELDPVSACETADTVPGRVRGRLINLSNCENVRISGLTLADGPAWNVHMIYSKNIVTDHCTFQSTGIWNGDGWDPDSSEDCTIFACEFLTGDDCVAIKSGKNPQGNRIARPTRRIRVFDCRCAFGHGLCLGSEMSGGIEDVKIWDCDLARSMFGIEVKGTDKRGGFVRGLAVRDCTVPCLLVHAVPYNNDGEPAPEPPVFEGFCYDNVTVTGRSLDKDWSDCPAVELRGFDAAHPVRDVRFRGLRITGGTGVFADLCENVRFLPAGAEP